MSSNPGGTIGGVPFEEHNQTDRLGEALCPNCGKTMETGCTPTNCDAWITKAIYDHAAREWVSLDDLNELEDAGA